MTFFEFEEVATAVEERFERSYHPTQRPVARSRVQIEYENISIGWWLVIKRLGLALWIDEDQTRSS